MPISIRFLFVSFHANVSLLSPYFLWHPERYDESRSMGYVHSFTPEQNRWKSLQDQDGIQYLLAPLWATTSLQPDAVQQWFQPQAFKGCSSALSLSLANEAVYKVFSKMHLLKLWGNQGFIKFLIRCKIHFVWSCKGNFCNEVKKSHCQIFQRNNVYR